MTWTMTDARPDAADILTTDTRAVGALDQFRLHRVRSSSDPAFAAGYDALAAEFAARDEIEPREQLASAIDEGGLPTEVCDSGGRRYAIRYHFIVAFDEDGALAGVRDCSVVWRVEPAVCVVHLSHTLVLPRWRRSGLAGLLRAAPVTLAKRELAAGGHDPGRFEIMLGAEMEPADPADPGSIGRLVSYGHAGFRVISPRHLPYCQPDFRPLFQTRRGAGGGGGHAPRPLPMLAVVVVPSRPEADALSADLCEAFIRHIYAVFGTYCPPDDLERPLEHALSTLSREAKGAVPLLPMPASSTDAAALAPLWRSAVLPHHLPELR